jgi:drug/metabolite transporter (DMT)-like permease
MSVCSPGSRSPIRARGPPDWNSWRNRYGATTDQRRVATGSFDYRDAALFGLTCLAWGANYTFVRAGLLYATPLWLAALRAGIGAIGVATYLTVVRPAVRLDARARRDAMLLGLPNTALFIGLWFVAASQVPAGQTAVLIYTFPLQVALLSVPLLGHRLSLRHWSAILTGFAGVALVSEPWASGSGSIPAVALVELLTAAFCWALSTVLFQRRFRSEEMPVVNAYQLLAGSAVLLGAAIFVNPTTLPRETVSLWVAVLWLGLFGTAFAYAVWFFLLGRVRAPTLATYAFLVPVVALAISATFTGERLDLVQVAGVVLVLLGIYGVARGRGAA